MYRHKTNLLYRRLNMAVYTNLNKNLKKNEKKVSISIILPIIAVLAVIPLITYKYEYYTHLETFDWYRGNPKQLISSCITKQ